MKIQTSDFQDLEEKNIELLTDGSHIEVVSTSASSAIASPIVLSQSDTDVTRVVFHPTIVNNINDINKSVCGKLVYERRSKGDHYPTDKITPKCIKTGEMMELTLDTTAIFNLHQCISSLYDIYSKNGIPYGIATYQRVDGCFDDFLRIIQNNPSAARMIGNPDNFELVKLLLQLITRTESLEALASALQNLRSDSIAQLSEFVSIERLSRVISLIDDNLDNSDEEFWQSTVFKENQWVLSQLFASPCTIFQDKAYVGGKQINNKNGNICDFIYQNKISGNIVLIEIKTPKSQLIHRPYRDTFSLTPELSGAINQVIHYRDLLVKNYNTFTQKTDRSFSAFNPKCVVIIGKISDLTTEQIATLDNYRHSLNNIEIVAYDEILLRLKELRNVFSDNTMMTQSDDDDNPFY